MTEMNVFCNHHSQFGKCLKEDWDDAKTGRNPSSMVRVVFETFTQAVPFNTLEEEVVYKYWKYNDYVIRTSGPFKTAVIVGDMRREYNRNKPFDRVIMIEEIFQSDKEEYDEYMSSRK